MRTTPYAAAGASGSCTWRMSNPPLRTKRSARAIAMGETATGATEPLDRTAVGRPIMKLAPADSGMPSG